MYNNKHKCESNSAVECFLAKEDAAGSSPVSRSIRAEGFKPLALIVSAFLLTFLISKKAYCFRIIAYIDFVLVISCNNIMKEIVFYKQI